jgi:hypothetical protein
MSQGRTTVYKGIAMRSRLEAGFAAWLDRKHFDWEYEPCAFASDDGQYLPDFRLRKVFAAWLPGLITAYVEVKPDTFMEPAFISRGDEARQERAHADSLLISSQARIIAASEPDALLFLMQPLTFHVITAVDSGFADVGPFYQPSPVILVGLPHDRVGFALGAGCVEGPWHDTYWDPRRGVA